MLPHYFTRKTFDMLGKALVHMLATDKAAHLGKCIKELSDVKIGELRYMAPMMMSLEYFQPQHLYFTTDEEIKEADWFIYVSTTSIELKKCLGRTSESIDTGGTHILYPSINDRYMCRKIVATTNPDLWKQKFSHYSQDLMKVAVYKHDHEGIAKIPTDFIEAYVRAEGKITEVMLEYEYEERKVQTLSKYPEYIYTERPMLKLRNNGTVIIKPVVLSAKDKAEAIKILVLQNQKIMLTKKTQQAIVEWFSKL